MNFDPAVLKWWTDQLKPTVPHCKHCNSRNVYMAKDGVKYVLKDASTGKIHDCTESHPSRKGPVSEIEK